MSGSGKAGNGRGNNRKRSFRQRDNDSWQEGDAEGNQRTFGPGTKGPRCGSTSGGTPEKRVREPLRLPEGNHSRQNRGNFSKRTGENSRGERNRVSFFERP
jgi:hypothetical protein